THSDIGLIGLAVMGQNLALNIADHGFRISVYNRTTEKTEKFVAENPNTPGGLVGAKTLEEFVASIAKPRKIIILVQAGKGTDAVIDSLVPLLDANDIVIDGGNALWTDTIRRERTLREKGLRFIGSGVSGGEEGARFGPSIMPGGSPSAWPFVKDIFQGISAKVDGGAPCCDWVGSGGSGHYVKMVHNGIEYGDMQLIGEAYHLMRDGLGMSADEMSAVFQEWNAGELDSFLIEITGRILAHRDEDGAPLVDKILDAAGQKGTGKWTVIDSANLGQPVTLIAEAVFARCVSAMKEERVKAARKLKGPRPGLTRARDPVKRKALIDDIRSALYASKIVSYAQGYMLMKAAAREYGWTLNYGGIALMWRGGCIIRSRFLGRIKEAFDKQPKLANLLLDDYFRGEIKAAQKGWRNVVALAVRKGLPVPAFSTALAFYDSYRQANLPANLLQAQRDYFGAHTYERVDRERGQFFHTNWTGTGGRVSSSTYNA
ncbi:MAG: decarboxylating NADP(+)-dependent phosphogluconate dehydrogenase, partial [Verrucomicrobiota bacterium]